MFKFSSPEVIFGVGALGRVGDCARRLGATRVLVVSDPGVAAAGWVERVLSSLQQEGITTTLFTGVTPNPKDHEVAQGRASSGRGDRGEDPLPSLWRRPAGRPARRQEVAPETDQTHFRGRGSPKSP